MVKFLLWCILLVLCWPMALLANLLYPLVWFLLLPFRAAGMLLYSPNTSTGCSVFST